MKKSFLLLFSIGLFVAATCNKTKGGDDCIDPKKIDEDAVCIELYQPVCGCDGKTYSNDCFARAAGLKKWTEGPCND